MWFGVINSHYKDIDFETCIHGICCVNLVSANGKTWYFVTALMVDNRYPVKKNMLINTWFAIRRLNKYIFYGKGFLKAHRPPKVEIEMKCTSEKMTWNIQDTNLSWYVPRANVGHTISGQGTAVNTLDHSATTPS